MCGKVAEPSFSPHGDLYAAGFTLIDLEYKPWPRSGDSGGPVYGSYLAYEINQVEVWRPLGV